MHVLDRPEPVRDPRGKLVGFVYHDHFVVRGSGCFEIEHEGQRHRFELLSTALTYIDNVERT